MNHLKTFALFESKTHNLELPKNEDQPAVSQDGGMGGMGGMGY